MGCQDSSKVELFTMRPDVCGEQVCTPSHEVNNEYGSVFHSLFSMSERLPSADRSQQILNSAERHRDSAARLCSPSWILRKISPSVSDSPNIGMISRPYRLSISIERFSISMQSANDHRGGYFAR